MLSITYFCVIQFAPVFEANNSPDKKFNDTKFLSLNFLSGLQWVPAKAGSSFTHMRISNHGLSDSETSKAVAATGCVVQVESMCALRSQCIVATTQSKAFVGAGAG